MTRDLRLEEVIRAERDVRAGSEFLRGQMRQWMEDVVVSGKTRDLFELEMWLRSFERFFRIRNQPLSERESHQLALRNWSEELRLVDNVMLRVIQLCAHILTEEQVNETRFGKYVENYLKKDDSVDPYIEKILRQSTPEAGLTVLRESFEDLHVMVSEMVKLARISFASFMSVGKMIYREIRRSQMLALLIDKKFKPIHDRISNPAIAQTIRGILSAPERKQAAKVFLEFFRLLHYLEFADPSTIEEEDLKNSILIFSLITAETRMLLTYLDRRVLKALPQETPLYQVYDSFVYCIPLELKKVVNTELQDIAVSRQVNTIRSRVENSHGILRDCYRQSVVQLAQAFDSRVQGTDIFPSFSAKRDQSLRLRDGLAGVLEAVHAFQTAKDEKSAQAMKDVISGFYDDEMRYLMYRDWSGFELFFIEILKCTSLSGLVQIAHRFETFLVTLFREVQKRGILVEPPPEAAADSTTVEAIPAEDVQPEVVEPEPISSEPGAAEPAATGHGLEALV